MRLPWQKRYQKPKPLPPDLTEALKPYLAAILETVETRLGYNTIVPDALDLRYTRSPQKGKQYEFAICHRTNTTLKVAQGYHTKLGFERIFSYKNPEPMPKW